MILVTPKSVTVTPTRAPKDSWEFDRIPSFAEFRFFRYELTLNGIDEDANEPYEFKIGFSSTKTTPKEALKEAVAAVEISFKLSGGNPDSTKKYYTYEYKDIETKEVIRFIKKFNPSQKPLEIDELEIADNYKYLHYSNCKFARELLTDNMEGIVFAETFSELKKILLDETLFTEPEIA